MISNRPWIGADRRGSSAAEFALVLPLLILLMFGVIDAGRFLWEMNRAEKATQMGARVAVVTDMVEPAIAAANYVNVVVGGVTLTQGDVIPVGAFGAVRCTNTACTCQTTPCPTAGAYNGAAFNRIADRVRAMKPDIQRSNVRVIYSGSGLGFAGDPNGMDLSPLVTVELNGVTFRPITTQLIGNPTFTLPTFRTTLTAEDSVGTTSN